MCVMSVRQAAELDHAFERNGWTPEDVKGLSKGSLLADFLKVLLEEAVIVGREQVIDFDADPFTPDGWSVEEHQKGGQLKWGAIKISLFLSRNQRRGGVIGGYRLRKELEGKPVYNANLLDYLLKYPYLIPEDWKGKAVYFWGTVYGSLDSGLRVRFLYWDNNRWESRYDFLNGAWEDGEPAAVRTS